MKRLVLMLLLAALTLAPAVAGAQDWVMDWNSHGSSVGILTGPFAEGWSISGTSPTVLTPGAIGPFGLPPNFSAPAYTLGFTWEGRNYGGPVSEQSNWQSFEWKAPVPCAGIFTSSCAIRAQDGGSASGSFAFTDPNHFRLDVFVGTGHSHTELVGLGTRTGGGVATAAEPTVLLLSGVGLVGAAIVRRARRD
jgi:hypothetical protein